MIVEVFKTNIGEPLAADAMLQQLRQLFPDYLINFDLEDCDKILRVAATLGIQRDQIIDFIRSENYEIEVLRD